MALERYIHITLPDNWDNISTRKPRCPNCYWSGSPDDLFRLDEYQRGAEYDKVLKATFRTGVIKQRIRNFIGTATDPGCISCIIRLALARNAGLSLEKAGALCVSRIDGKLAFWRPENFDNEDEALLRQQRWSVFTQLVTAEAGLRGIPQKTLLSRDTASEESLKFILRRLTTCKETHTSCILPSPEFCPTRLICVRPLNEQGDIKLMLSSEIPRGARYMALSHCWGRELPSCLTTSSRISSYLQSISFRSLPKTFRHAVIVSRRLGVDYIWIDSLCIIQGDSDDWAREASLMFQVYRNSYLTLSALHSLDSSGGLYSTRDPDCQFQIATVQKGDEVYPLYARSNFRGFPYLHGYYYGDLAQAHHEHQDPLFSRAWVFQERLNSPRNLLFGRDELIWECYSATACECEGDFAENQETGSFQCYGIEYLSPKVKYWTHERKSNSDVPIAQRWRELVTEYCKLQITYETDRLVAIGGIASNFQQARGKETYLAGLWSGSLLADLLWNPVVTAKSRRSHEYVAPSWSWASAGGCNPWYPLLPSNVEPYDDTALMRVIEASCEYVNKHPFSLCTDGRLYIQGRVFRGMLARRELLGGPVPTEVCFYSIEKEGKTLSTPKEHTISVKLDDPAILENSPQSPYQVQLQTQPQRKTNGYDRVDPSRLCEEADFLSSYINKLAKGGWLYYETWDEQQVAELFLLDEVFLLPVLDRISPSGARGHCHYLLLKPVDKQESVYVRIGIATRSLNGLEKQEIEEIRGFGRENKIVIV